MALGEMFGLLIHFKQDYCQHRKGALYESIVNNYIELITYQ